MIALLGAGLNKNSWKPIVAFLEEQRLPFVILSDHKEISPNHSLAIILGYQRIISAKYIDRPIFGSIVFHSSNLPEGRGWAPLFYTLEKGSTHLWQTLFYAEEEVDSGPIIARASYPIDRLHTIADLRAIDDQLTLALCKEFLPKLATGRIDAAAQDHSFSTTYERRTAENSEIDPQKSILELWNTLRALPENIPPFFSVDGVRVELSVKVCRDFEIDLDKVRIVSTS